VSRRRGGWIALAVCVTVLALIGVLATRPNAGTRIVDSPLVGLPAPPVVGTALDGRPVDLSVYRGRYVVLNFFATWCQPCREEHPEMIEFTERHPGENAPAIVGVAYDANDVSNARSFFAEFGGNWPVVSNGSQIAVSYGVRGLPESFVIDPDGRVKNRVAGALTADGLDTLTGQL
jgi:cytochrome c biogenesis protein CcmG, thiol:disulfide interchange protein DsbE